MQNKINWKKITDQLVSIISIIFPLTALPQIYNIWIVKEVEGVSLLTWLFFLILGVPLFLYATAHKDRRLQVMFGMWCAVYFLVVLGLLIYR